MSNSPKAGDAAPSFDLPDGAGGRVSLASLQGKPVVLYFYPKDDTPGCTREACAFRDLKAEFDKAGATILGVSPDGPASHEKFTGKYALTFPLLSDPDHKVAEAYGVWGEKKNYGRTYMGITRATFLIDGQGKVAKVWPKVKVDGHADAVLEAVRALG
jgi:peroxiredoxin Q/BCP